MSLDKLKLMYRIGPPDSGKVNGSGATLCPVIQEEFD